MSNFKYSVVIGVNQLSKSDMLPYQTLINIDRTLGIPLYIQISNSFIELIKQGILKPADVLPSTRKLAELILINRNTANLAYEELISQGWAESIDRKGIFVTELLGEPSEKIAEKSPAPNQHKTGFLWTNKFINIIPVHNLQKHSLAIDGGFPDVRLAPIDSLMTEYRSISKRFYGKSFLKYGTPRGCENLRKSISKYLSATRGLSSVPENIIITKGSQMGLYLAAQTLLDPGDIVAVGNSNHRSTDATFELCKATLLRIPIDENGMDIDYLEQELKSKTIKAVYILPHHHFPTTVTLNFDRRSKLLRLAKEHSFAIIEDDHDFEFHYEGNIHLPLATRDDNDNVIYIGSFSKTLAPSIRIGFLIGPNKFINAAATLRNLVDRQGDTLTEEALSALFSNGEIDRHFRKAIKIYRERRNIFCNILSTEFKDLLEFEAPKGGLAVWTAFDPGIDMAKVSETASKKGLYLFEGSCYKNESFNPNALRLGFASLEVNEMTQALEILRQSIPY